MEKLTVKQERVLKAVKKFFAEKGYPPTVRDLCNLTGLSSTATVHVHLDHLQRKGYIKKDKDKNRTMELLVPNEYAKQDDSVVSIPLLGRASCGNPIEAIENPDEYLDVPSFMLNPKKETFSLNVTGDSMINAGILDNDIVLVEKKKTCNNGEIVVAMNDDNEVTIKRFYKENGHIRLQPENDLLEPIILDNCTILGKVTALYRKF